MTLDTRIPSMFDKVAEFAGIILQVDPINRQRTESSDNVMAIFYEEQPFWWEFAKEDISRAIKNVDGEIDFLDVGTGSGVSSILVAKYSGAKNIIAIDKSRRAVKKAEINAELNGVEFLIRHEYYNMGSASYKSCKAIAMNPPYHIYPPETENKIPQHARGGVDGQQIFREQLGIANYHLADQGIIAFNMMCLGRNGRPEFVDYIPKLVEGASLKYTEIFPHMRTAEFISEVYSGTDSGFFKQLTEKFPELYFCDGIITRDHKGEVTKVKHDIDLKGRSWADRLKLHREISRHESQ